MSDTLAVAAVTATLRRLLRKMLPESIGGKVVDVTASNPAKLGTPDATDDHLRLNLFLYQMLPNAAWRNQAPPRSKPGETAPAPLALDLHYLLTAYAAGEELAFESLQLLGQGLAILHDNPILGPDAVRLTDNGPAEDLLGERIRITPQPLSVDDISKLWSAFQTSYVTSAAFQVSVVLIESTRVTKPAPPVLSRGEKDKGVGTQPDLTPPYPTVTSLDLAVPGDDPARARRPSGQPLFEPEEKIRILGGKLRVNGRNVRVLLRPAGRPPVCILEALDAASTAERLTVRLRVAANSPPLRAGLHTLAVEVETGEGPNPTRLTNEVPLLLAPRIADVQPSGPVGPGATLTVTCAPPVRAGQRVALLVGGGALAPADFADGATVLRFDLTPAKLPRGPKYPLRLRVDGVDSLAASAADPFAFANTLEVA